MCLNFLSSFSHIVLTKEELILLRELSDRTGYARVKANHSVKCLNKITSKKKHPDVITFVFEDNETLTDSHSAVDNTLEQLITDLTI